MKSWFICIVLFLKLDISPVNAKVRNKSSFQDKCKGQCPQSQADLDENSGCTYQDLEECICTLPDESNCYLTCGILDKWTKICKSSMALRPRIGDNTDSTEEDDMCECPNKNPLTMNSNSCDSDSWDACKKSCTYSNPLCSYSCDGDQWVEQCVEHFESNSTLNCNNGRCNLSDECQIPRSGGYWIRGPHLSGMAGEYLLTPDGCTGACIGCELSSSGRTSHVTVYVALGISIITALF